MGKKKKKKQKFLSAIGPIVNFTPAPYQGGFSIGAAIGGFIMDGETEEAKQKRREAAAKKQHEEITAAVLPDSTTATATKKRRM